MSAKRKDWNVGRSLASVNGPELAPDASAFSCVSLSEVLGLSAFTFEAEMMMTTMTG